MELLNDLIFTRKFLIKGNIGPRKTRLSHFLDFYTKDFLHISQAEITDTLSGEKFISNDFYLRLQEILFAHEFVDCQGDPSGKLIHSGSSLQRGKILFCGSQPILVEGLFRDQLFEKNLLSRRFVVVQDPVVKGIPEPVSKEFYAIPDLKYLIVNQEKIAYLFLE